MLLPSGKELLLFGDAFASAETKKPSYLPGTFSTPEEEKGGAADLAQTQKILFIASGPESKIAALIQL